MPRKKRPIILERPVKEGREFKVRLDQRTVITLSTKKALEMWRKRYPKLEVLG
ncbi:MAG: hypothetical protein KIT10_07930 [Flavobacteriales bacterium]|nr:hypothetical protein [Flavobacteriales bacterium]